MSWRPYQLPPFPLFPFPVHAAGLKIIFNLLKIHILLFLLLSLLSLLWVVPFGCAMRLGLNVNELVDYKFDYFICQRDFAGDCVPTNMIEEETNWRRKTVKRVSQFARLFRFIELFFFYFFNSSFYFPLWFCCITFDLAV